MKKFLLALATLFLFPFLANAQTTLQVTDAGGQTWNNGTWSVQLVVGNNIQYGGQLYVGTTVVPNQVQSGSLSATGSASITLTPNITITPVPTLWNYTVCPNANSTCFVRGISITASNQAVTLTPPIPQVTQSVQNRAYADNEILNPLPGAQYYNVVSNTQRICNGPAPCTWADAGGGGGGTVTGTGAAGSLAGWTDVSSIGLVTSVPWTFGMDTSNSIDCIGSTQCDVDVQDGAGASTVMLPGGLVTNGTVGFSGTTSGSALIGVAAAAGGPSEILLPTADPIAGQVLTAGTPSGGKMQTSWGTGSAFAWGGQGSDGSLTYDGSTTILGVAPIANVYTLTRDVFSTSLTVNPGVTIITNNYALFCTGTLTNNGTISNNGGNGSNGGNSSSSAGGAIGSGGGGVALGHYPVNLAGLAGTTGGTGTSTNGTQATAPAAGLAGNTANMAIETAIQGNIGAAGGKGGDGTSGTGAAGRVGTAAQSSVVVSKQIARNPWNASRGWGFTSTGTEAVYSGTGNASVSPGGAGGSGGGGDNTNSGGGGGGGGGTGGIGGWIGIFSKTIINTGMIQSNGGSGGNGGNGFTPVAGNCGGGGGGGAGSGGNGGIVWLVYITLTNTGTIQALGGSPGTPGTAGSPSGSGTNNATNGGAGSSGVNGVVVQIQNL